MPDIERNLPGGFFWETVEVKHKQHFLLENVETKLLLPWNQHPALHNENSLVCNKNTFQDTGMGNGPEDQDHRL